MTHVKGKIERVHFNALLRHVYWLLKEEGKTHKEIIEAAEALVDDVRYCIRIVDAIEAKEAKINEMYEVGYSIKEIAETVGLKEENVSRVIGPTSTEAE